MTDAFLNYSSLKMSMKYYVPEGKDSGQDSFMSIYGTPDWVLRQYPKVVMGICELDALRDDSFRFVSRLLTLEKEVKIYYNRFMPHGLLNMSGSTVIPEASRWTEKSYEIILDYINKRRIQIQQKVALDNTILG